VIEAKKIKLFENAVTRLFYVGRAGRWVALVDSECAVTLLCEVIKAEDREYMKEHHGYDINSHLDIEPINNLLLIINPTSKDKSSELLHAFESGGDFSMSKIPELENFYLNSDDVNFRGLGRRWKKPTTFELFYLTVLLVLCYILSKFV